MTNNTQQFVEIKAIVNYVNGINTNENERSIFDTENIILNVRDIHSIVLAGERQKSDGIIEKEYYILIGEIEDGEYPCFYVIDEHTHKRLVKMLGVATL